MSEAVRDLYLCILRDMPVGRYLASHIDRAGCSVTIDLATHKILDNGQKLKFRGFTQTYYLENIDE